VADRDEVRHQRALSHKSRSETGVKARSGQRAKASIAVSPNADRCPVSQSPSQAIPCANTLVVDRFSMGGGSRRGGKFSAHVSLLLGAVEQVLD
jgi:hypothetical protein